MPRVRVRILGGEVKEVEVDNGARVADVLRAAELLSTEYVVTKNGRVVAEDELVTDGDELVLYPVVSGG
ncbi:thiamineS protein [Pyrolobus fumarii 1A]|uniref:ThiamineS protein n=1 Tax=Pyrolobus fumarii (strain DSM 11204 / 1A) TaxID=694429 RepID=G0ECR0_PYRF1|nr:MoaD/ThiS family protein [Pyrolobus fumarii]AEM39630.1 thiamineS protein [Pyrolobus fumarii 1A]